MKLIIKFKKLASELGIIYPLPSLVVGCALSQEYKTYAFSIGLKFIQTIYKIQFIFFGKDAPLRIIKREQT